MFTSDPIQFLRSQPPDRRWRSSPTPPPPLHLPALPRDPLPPGAAAPLEAGRPRHVSGVTSSSSWGAWWATTCAPHNAAGGCACTRASMRCRILPILCGPPSPQGRSATVRAACGRIAAAARPSGEQGGATQIPPTLPPAPTHPPTRRTRPSCVKLSTNEPCTGSQSPGRVGSQCRGLRGARRPGGAGVRGRAVRRASRGHLPRWAGPVWLGWAGVGTFARLRTLATLRTF